MILIYLLLFVALILLTLLSRTLHIFDSILWGHTPQALRFAISVNNRLDFIRLALLSIKEFDNELRLNCTVPLFLYLSPSIILSYITF